MGWDFSGRVEADFKEGDPVFGMINFHGHGKAYAEYVVAPEKQLALKPDTISHPEAAATCLAALSAWQVLVHQADLPEGQHLLMQADTGGLGHFVVRIARPLGAKVTGTVSAANLDFLQEIGIHNHID